MSDVKKKVLVIMQRMQSQNVQARVTRQNGNTIEEARCETVSVRMQIVLVMLRSGVKLNNK